MGVVYSTVVSLMPNQSASTGLVAKLACIVNVPSKFGVTVYVTVCNPSADPKYPSPFNDKKLDRIN